MVSQVTQIMSLRNEVMEQHERIRAAEAEKLDAENEIHLLKDAIAAKRAEGCVPHSPLRVTIVSGFPKVVALLHKSSAERELVTPQPGSEAQSRGEGASLPTWSPWSPQQRFAAVVRAAMWWCGGSAEFG